MGKKYRLGETNPQEAALYVLSDTSSSETGDRNKWVVAKYLETFPGSVTRELQQVKDQLDKGGEEAKLQATKPPSGRTRKPVDTYVGTVC